MKLTTLVFCVVLFLGLLFSEMLDLEGNANLGSIMLATCIAFLKKSVDLLAKEV